MEEDNCMATCQMYKRTIWDRMGFGTCSARMEDEDHPDLAEAYISTDVYSRFDWKDRLRILFSGKVMVSLATKTSVIVEKAVSASKVSVLPPNYPFNNPNGGKNAH